MDSRKKKIRKIVYHTEDEEVIVINKSAYYKLGHPLDDVVRGSIIADAVPAHWCDIEQRWIT